MKKFLLILFIFSLVPVSSAASTVLIEADTYNISINALEATIQIPKSVTVTKILDGNSPLIFWVRPAVLDKDTNTISFAGITPGGFAGNGTILSIVGDFQVGDYKNITFKEVMALKNDGQGTLGKIKLYASNGADVVDSVPPEPFKPIISNSPDLFNNKKFLSFVTQDKGVGIDHYEFKGEVVESPVELSLLNLFQKISIKAVDKSGNEIVQSTVGPFYYYLWSFVWVIIISLALWVLSYIRRRLQ
jgi:hypothetical protein